MDDAATSDEALIEAWRRGDRWAGESFLARVEPAVAAVCWALTGERSAVEEAVQECFLRVVKGLHGYRRGAPPRPWILAIARNAARDQIRRARRALPLDAVPEPSDAATPEDALLRREDAEAVSLMIDGLRPTHREVLVLKYALDLDNETIAATLGIGCDALWMRLSRARRELRRVARVNL